jgi:hypothetical protein
LRRRRTWTCPWRIRSSSTQNDRIDDRGARSDLHFPLWRAINGQSAAVKYQQSLGRYRAAHSFPLSGKEIPALRQLRRENMDSRYVFLTERRGPATTAGFLKTISRIGEVAKLPFPIHPQCCGILQAISSPTTDTIPVRYNTYMGHKNIMHTVRYSDMAPDRFKNFWKD